MNTFGLLASIIASAAVVLFMAEIAVKYAVKLAHRFRLSDEFIGMTVLAIGTSIPEIVTHIVGSVEILARPASLNAVSSVVIGANIGSDIFQQTFLLGVVALIGVVFLKKSDLIKDVGGVIIASVLLLLASIGGVISRFEGFLLVLLYLLYLWYLRKKGLLTADLPPPNYKNHHTTKNVLILLLSFIVMGFAADMMLRQSLRLVDSLGLSASLVGVILLGVVSAFPELITSVIAIRKHKAKMSAGVLIGSNITNPLLALGLGAMISTYAVANTFLYYDMPIKIFSGILLLWLLWDGKLKKKEAAILIALYLLYVLLRNAYFPFDVFS